MFQTNSSPEKIGAMLNIEGIVEGCSSKFAELFIMYAVCEKLELGEITVGYKAVRLAKNVSGIQIPDVAKIGIRVSELKKKCIEEKGKRKFQDAYNFVLNKSKKIKNPVSFVSAKDYIFPFIMSKCKNECGCTIKQKQVTIATSQHVNANENHRLKNAINHAFANAIA